MGPADGAAKHQFWVVSFLQRGEPQEDRETTPARADLSENQLLDALVRLNRVLLNG
jgi:hypothetical protein